MIRFLTTQTFVFALAITSLFGGNDNNVTYLALGDSIAFGYDPTLFAPGHPLPKADKFVGYPERVAEFKHLLQSKNEVNAACPGETSGSFLSAGAPDNGCLLWKFKQVPPGVGLHTAYTATQGSFAVSELESNAHINLVTLSIGGNDLLLLQDSCKNPNPLLFGKCVSDQLPATLAAFGGNLASILSRIRFEAKYKGTLVLVTNYVPNADPLFLQAIAALNQTMVTVGSQFGVKFADGFTAFRIISKPFGAQGYDPCKAGLLIHLSATTCDVHPSPFGRDVLAVSVLHAIGAF